MFVFFDRIRRNLSHFYFCVTIREIIFYWVVYVHKYLQENSHYLYIISLQMANYLNASSLNDKMKVDVTFCSNAPACKHRHTDTHARARTHTHTFKREYIYTYIYIYIYNSYMSQRESTKVSPNGSSGFTPSELEIRYKD